jgi:hypothetical protein
MYQFNRSNDILSFKQEVNLCFLAAKCLKMGPTGLEPMTSCV